VQNPTVFTTEDKAGEAVKYPGRDEIPLRENEDKKSEGIDELG
jgi:hypothetical protein